MFWGLFKDLRVEIGLTPLTRPQLGREGYLSSSRACFGLWGQGCFGFRVFRV